MFEILFEMLGQIFAELIGEVIIRGLDKATGGKFGLKKSFAIYLLVAILGFAAGHVSLQFYGAVIKTRSLQIANLIVMPLVVGTMMHYLGRLKESRGRKAMVLDKFLGGYLFALTFALARFFLANG